MHVGNNNFNRWPYGYNAIAFYLLMKMPEKWGLPLKRWNEGGGRGRRRFMNFRNHFSVDIKLSRKMHWAQQRKLGGPCLNFASILKPAFPNEFFTVIILINIYIRQHTFITFMVALCIPCRTALVRRWRRPEKNTIFLFLILTRMQMKF